MRLQIVISLVTCSIAVISGCASSSSINSTKSEEALPSLRNLASTDSSRSEIKKIAFEQVACASYVTCGIEKGSRKAFCKDSNMGSKGGSWQVETSESVTEVAVERGWDLKNVKYLSSGMLKSVSGSGFRGGAGTESKKLGTADALSDSFWGASSYKGGQLVSFRKDMIDDRYYLDFTDGKWSGSPFSFGADFQDTTFFAKYPDFFEAAKRSTKIIANESQVCALFPNGSGKCIQLPSNAVDRKVEEVLDIPSSENLLGLVAGRNYMYFWSSKKLIEFRRFAQSRYDFDFSGIKKVIVPGSSTYVLLEDGNLNELYWNNASGKAELRPFDFPGGERAGNKQRHPRKIKFIDVASGISTNNWFCAVNEDGRILNYWPATSSNAMDSLKEISFKAQSDDVLD